MRRAALLLALLALAGCGRRSTEVREPDVIVRGDDAVATREAPERRRAACGSRPRGSSFVTHGQASDPFWTIVKRGLGDAGRQTGAAVSYRAPDRFSIERMRRFIDEAVADRPDGLVVSLPDAQALAPSIRAAVRGRHPGRDDQLRQRRVQVARRARARRPAGVPGGRRERRADGPRGRASARCASTRSPATAGSTSAAAGSPTGCAAPAAASRPLPVPLQDPATAQRRMASAIADGPGRRHPHARPGRRRAGDRRRARERPRVARHARDVRPLARGADRGARRRHAVRGRPAAVPAGLPAGDPARRAGAPPGLPGPRRADPDRARSSSPRRTRPT